MGRPRGFLEIARAEDPLRGEEERLADFGELHIRLDAENRHAQASRCMNCGVPFCQSGFGCPLHNLIPEWNDLLYRGLEREALERLLETAPFPEFTGRVCPALCEKACNLESAAATNRDSELYLAETGFAKGWIAPRAPEKRTGKRVAVVGSGPAGLAAADLLNRLGHCVTVIERADRPGGLLMYGIPNMKLPKAVVERRISLMEEEGVRFVTGVQADPAELAEYGAVLLCAGARRPRRLNVENEDAAGVCFAVDYLSGATKAVLSGADPAVTAKGKRVVVVGGGDTGNDCVGTALRQGCASVVQLEMMPEPPAERPAGDPWPLWPRTLRTDYGQLEAIYRQGADPRVYRTTVRRVLKNGAGEITGIETVRVGRDESGRMAQIPGTEKELPCALLLIAAGFLGCETETARLFRAETDARGNLSGVGGSHMLRDGLFSAGDMRTGQSLVVRALADGRAAAKEVHAYLS